MWHNTASLSFVSFLFLLLLSSQPILAQDDSSSGDVGHCHDGKLSLNLDGEFIMVHTGVMTNCSSKEADLICCMCVGDETIETFVNTVSKIRVVWTLLGCCL